MTSTQRTEQGADNRLPSAGFLLIDKPKGVTSHDVVAACRPALHTRHVGHAGTLDPMATGLLIIGFGAATRLLNYVVGEEKTYEAVIRLGAATTTDDAEGELISATQPATVACSIRDYATAEGSAIIDRFIEERFSGKVEQVPSTYSAIKIAGKRAYELARSGRSVELGARSITISGFERLKAESVQATSGAQYLDLTVRITCSAGTYIRAIARDLGEVLGVGGYLTYLRRTRIGSFKVSDAMSVATQEKTFTDKTGAQQHRLRVVVDPERAARASTAAADTIKCVMPTVAISAEDAQDLQYGRSIDAPVFGPTAALFTNESGLVQLCAILEPSRGRAHPVTVFPFTTSNQ